MLLLTIPCTILQKPEQILPTNANCNKMESLSTPSIQKDNATLNYGVRDPDVKVSVQY